MEAPQLDALSLLSTPVWLVLPRTQEIFFANSAAMNLSVELNLGHLRHGRFSARSQTQLDAYLCALAKKELIVEIWTVQKEGITQPLSCRLSLAQWEGQEPVIVVEGITGSEIASSELTSGFGRSYHREDNCIDDICYEQFFRTSSAPMLLIDPEEDGRIVDANLAAIRFYGYPPEEMLQKHTWEINVMGRDVLPVMNEVAKLPGGHKPLSFMHKLSDGSTRYVQTYASPVILNGKRLMLGIIHDITEQKRLEQELQQQALQDPLTGLWNRRQFLHLVQSAHTQTERYGQNYSMLMIDADLFKNINDQYGHRKGDEVLLLLARTLESRVRESDSVCRWGGEEFVILLPQTNLDGALSMAESLRQTVEQFSRPDFPHITVSIGVAECQTGEDVDTLFKRVDEALYHAKASGRNRVASG
ncbi:diguanylate cyclase [Methylobacillus sp. MM3]|uniref:sensor domain-containing diguanylate cyclase n=1 Tax=Methylobacillus sp. MM3 TaxID=1848039 RepID=UPI0007E17047|nr:diguanylate cyclase [Methylobacillus sp. MM3]OAJ70557.1 diguanylate cyclase [Methylobacillus sp. MM3]